MGVSSKHKSRPLGLNLGHTWDWGGETELEYGACQKRVALVNSPGLQLRPTVSSTLGVKTDEQ